MTLDRFFNMVVNVVTRRLINSGINKGLNWFSRRGAPGSPVIPADVKHRQQARETARRARQAAKITRRLGR
jgi:hypothetical protein